MFAATHFRAMARNDAWSNHRLLKASRELTQDEFEAKRVSFFPSLQLTLNHILLVDWYYLDGLEKGGRGLSIFESEIPFPTLSDLAVAQRATDTRLVRYCDGLTEEALEARALVRPPNPPPGASARDARGHSNQAPAARRVLSGGGRPAQ
jgi:uncharacterized damage-inducible protein DinB